MKAERVHRFKRHNTDVRGTVFIEFPKSEGEECGSVWVMWERQQEDKGRGSVGARREIVLAPTPCQSLTHTCPPPPSTTPSIPPTTLTHTQTAPPPSLLLRTSPSTSRPLAPCQRATCCGCCLLRSPALPHQRSCGASLAPWWTSTLEQVGGGGRGVGGGGLGLCVQCVFVHGVRGVVV